APRGGGFEPPFTDLDAAPAWSGEARPELTRETAPIGVRLRPRFVPLGAAEATAYAEMCSDPSPLFRGEPALAPPALLAAQPSRLLRENFSYGPSVHTRSEIRHLAPARAGGVYRIDAVLRETYTRNENDYVTADVLIRDDAGVPVAQIRHTVIFRFAPRRS
ncbi:MAG TPA: hypothetical protein VFA70_14850, partial [Dehalococcoidia bacterium]|nr:hypothetical protein [Dehalococcoidia bacterium]